ncbi:ATP-binding cassette domain-containing protein [Rothia amarae]|uniref:ATP-binding cassette domain-containing protein n=1 Tax=Rothia amarae TaxID=169480 RepID=A0A7H2BM01_9MICC|nr:ATP-binding cassette domain-containing protein [Rothia amarae]QNV40697.1 ATP-binding cassette domain-containing protein [Rothia amarae]
MNPQHPRISQASIAVHNGELSFGSRKLWSELDLTIQQGEYFAVLGPNGSGKSTFLKVVLGLTQLNSGSISVLGSPAKTGNPGVGYIPQQRPLPTNAPLRARDFVGLGIDGHKWGIRVGNKKQNAVIDQLLEAVGATEYAKVPIGLLSGGEQQRLRIAQALANDPQILLADEALLSLDLNHQYAVSDLIHRYNKEKNATVVFVTHEINPIIDHVDRVLYLANGRFTVGTVEEVMRSEVLSDLYQTQVTVIRTNGRYVVVGGDANAPLDISAGDITHPHCSDHGLGSTYAEREIRA